MVQEGIIDNAQDWTLFVDQTKGDAYVGKSMDEIGRAVYKEMIR